MSQEKNSLMINEINQTREYTFKISHKTRMFIILFLLSHTKQTVVEQQLVLLLCNNTTVNS